MKVFIGVDPHKLSVTIEVVDRHETVLATGGFATDNAGYDAHHPARTRVVPRRSAALQSLRACPRNVAVAIA